MFITALGISCGVYAGYCIGWIKGYEQKEKDDSRIELEMKDFWKEIDQFGLRSHSPKVVFSSKL
ncbi:hypothetical protein [Bacillus sp. ISL-77]|uniref:hypothetical protein n=1 Tax=Bacillus sp. ISL-77 TaxID=2819138 RepID=UPI001BE86D6A|nr:hypothetical protein [Bacillus sp. ISL-77]MBT2743175.1 hypothetical protein [Bacillus sp. ISL-77]